MMSLTLFEACAQIHEISLIFAVLGRGEEGSTMTRVVILFVVLLFGFIS
jgi:hypothetical protein